MCSAVQPIVSLNQSWGQAFYRLRNHDTTSLQKEMKGVENVVSVKTINYLSSANGSVQTSSHSGISLIIQQEKCASMEAPARTFYLDFWTNKRLTVPKKNTQVLEITLDAMQCKNLGSQSIPLKVTERIQQFTTLLFAYYTFYVQTDIDAPIDQAVLLLVELILNSNRDRLCIDEDYAAMIHFMEQNVHQSLTIDDFCLALHISRASLNRLSKKYSELSVMKLFRNYKCKTAERFLLESSFTIQEISRMLGFKDTSHFIKTFKKIKGVTPLTFRRETGGIVNETTGKGSTLPTNEPDIS